MGRLILFQRNIDLAGDDLYVPAIHSCCLHVIWLICISVVYGLVDDTCLVSANFTYYLVFHLLFLVAMIPLEITIALVSMSGTVAKIGMRKYLSFLFHVHIFLSLFEFGIQIFGMYVLYGRRPLANSLICLSSVSEAKVALGYLTIIWGFVASIFWVFYMAFILYASKTNQKLHITKYYDVWKQRLAFCGFHKKLTNGTDVLTEVAETFADYLHDVDWAPSDFLVGMLLLKREQKTIREANQERRRKDFLAEKNARMNNEASRKSQVGSFSSRDTPMDVMVAPIWDSVRNYMPFDRSSTSSAHGSINSFQEKQSNSNSKYGYEVMTKGHIPDILHFAKYAEVAYIEKQCRKLCKGSLLFFSNDNDIFKSPFFIARDDKWKCIVVSIRGTYSAADWLVDLQVEPELIPIPDLGPNKKHYTHKGIMRTAKNILRQLKQNDNLKNMIEDPQSPSYGYDVVVTGHSLGAGAATLVCYMLRLYGYSRTRCYAFDPPGQLLTLEAAKYFDTFTISIVTGDDMICRLSQNSLQILKMDIARLLSECDLPKYKIFGGALSTLCFGSKAAKRPRLPTINRRSIAERVDDQRKKSISLASQKEFEYRASSRFSWVLKPFSPILRNEIQKKVKGFVKAIDPTAPHEHDVHDKECMEQSKGLPFPQMYIPGRILYIEKCRLWGDEEDIDLPWTTSRYSMMTDSSSHSSSSSSSSKGSSTPKKKKGKAKYSYAPRWASREEFQEIIVSRTLLSDHFPFPLLEELNNTSPGRKLRASRMN